MSSADHLTYQSALMAPDGDAYRLYLITKVGKPVTLEVASIGSVDQMRIAHFDAPLELFAYASACNLRFDSDSGAIREASCSPPLVNVPLPEPAGGLLCGVLLLGILAWRRRH